MAEKAKDPVASAGMWGAIATAAGSIVGSGVQLTGMLNKDIRENNLAVAEANARAAEAAAQTSGESEKMFGIDKKYLMIGGAVLVLLIVGLLFMRKS